MLRITGPYVFALIVTTLYSGTVSCLALTRPASISAWSAAACWECAAWHIALSLGVWCYCRTVLTSPGFVDEPEVQAFLRQHRSDRSLDGRRCEECEQAKPHRAYHSRVVDRCVLRFDHVCVFANNCVGAGNHKFFLLWQIYQFLASVFMVKISSEVIRAQVLQTAAAGVEDVLLMLPAGLTLLGSLITAGFPGIYLPGHLSRAGRNISNVEQRKGISFDCGGRLQNLDRLLGRRRWLWWLPLQAPGLATVLSPETEAETERGRQRGRKREGGRGTERGVGAEHAGKLE